MLSRGEHLLKLTMSKSLEEKNCVPVQNNLSDIDNDCEELISNNDFHRIASSTVDPLPTKLTQNQGFIEISPTKLKVDAIQIPNLSESSSSCLSRLSRRSSMHSNSSLSCSSSDNESCLSSEDCDDLINDRLYEPNESEGDYDEQDFGKPKLNSTKIQTVSSVDTSHESQSSQSVASNTSSDICSDIVNTSTFESLTWCSIFVTSTKKTSRMVRNEDSWRRNIIKKARNLGKEYEINSKDKKMKSARSMRPPCTEQ